MLLLVHFQVKSQYIYSVSVDISNEPNTIQVTGSYFPGYISRVEVNDQESGSDSVVVHLYFQHCLPHSILYYFDTTVTTSQSFPYDVWAITYFDSTSYSEVWPYCAYDFDQIMPADTFHLSAAQILSTRQGHREASIILHPNPAVEYLHLQSPVPWGELRVYSATGIEVMHFSANDSNPQVPVGHLPQGLYVMVIYGQEGEAIGRSKFVRSP